MANVDPAWNGRGLARALIARAKAAAFDLGARAVIAPVRPTQKFLFPDLSMDEYARRSGPDGAPVDSWIRAHFECGANIEGVCAESVRVEASLSKWRDWTGRALDEGGAQPAPPGGLAPLIVDLAADRATYSEPNVWMRYDVPRG